MRLDSCNQLNQHGTMLAERLADPVKNRNNKIVVHNVLCDNIGTGTPRPAPDLSRIEVPNRQSTLFPNPTTGVFQIPLSLGSQSLRIFDNKGRVVQNKALGNNQVQVSVDISDQPDGLYFIRIDQGNATRTLKILKNE